METQDLTKVTINNKCYFLNMIPLEMRQNIYEYLIAPMDRIDMYKYRYRHRTYMQHQHVKKRRHSICRHPPAPKLELELCILRTNQQIHDEATSLFFSKVTLAMAIADLNDLQLTPEMHDTEHTERCSLELCAPRSDEKLHMWKHSPLRGIGYTNEGKPFYAQSPQNGRMEPHIFARFRKIVFEVTFYEMRKFFEFEFVEFEHKYSSLVMTEEVQNTRLFEILRRVLTLVPRIDALEVVIATESDATFFGGYGSGDNVDDDAKDFLESGVPLPSQYIIESKSMLKPLMNLTNVDQFTLRVQSYKLSLEGFQCSMSDLSNHATMVTKYQEYLAKFPRARIVGEIERSKDYIQEYLDLEVEAAEEFQLGRLTTERLQGHIAKFKKAQKDYESKILEDEEKLRRMDATG